MRAANKIMKNIPFASVLMLLSLFYVASMSSSAAASPTTSATATRKQSVALPANVDIYATISTSDGQECRVGARADEDGLAERPVVYLVKPDGGFAWHVQLHIPKDAYQGRATHCVASANAIYVLVQIDTDSQQSSNQTLLQAVELDRKSGAVIASKDVDLPNISAAYTSWVEEGNEHFMWDGSKLVIKGKYQLMSDRDDPSGKDPFDFTLKLAGDLR
jgi:hypothetical protein